MICHWSRYNIGWKISTNEAREEGRVTMSIYNSMWLASSGLSLFRPPHPIYFTRYVLLPNGPAPPIGVDAREKKQRHDSMSQTIRIGKGNVTGAERTSLQEREGKMLPLSVPMPLRKEGSLLRACPRWRGDRTYNIDHAPLPNRGVFHQSGMWGEETETSQP